MGDVLTDQLIRGDIPEEKLPSGMTRIVCREFPPLPEQLPEVAEWVRMRMADQERTARGKLYHRCSLVTVRQPRGEGPAAARALIGGLATGQRRTLLADSAAIGKSI